MDIVVIQLILYKFSTIKKSETVSKRAFDLFTSALSALDTSPRT